MSLASPRLSVRELLHPRSVAVFGASEDRGKFGGRILHYLMRHGYAGRIFPINPNRETVNGLACYADVRRIGEPVDMAILAVPARSIVAAVEACAKAGVGCCTIVSTGFAEASTEGAAVQEQLVQLGRSTGMRLIGPNCMGLINPHHALALTSSLVLDMPAMRRGRVGLISQSGALMVALFDRANDAGVGFSSCISLGNQADLEICDFLAYMIDDPATDVICLYIEGLKDAQRFRRLIEQAQQAGKPVLAVKTGRTEAGVRAARSHTASLAGSYAVFEAVCRERGVVLLDDPDGMILTADLFARFGAPREGGAGILSPSGGGAGIAVDRVVEAGLSVARFSADTRAELQRLLVPAQADNPIDLGGRRTPDAPGTAAEILRIMAADADVGSVLVVQTTTPRFEATSREIGETLLSLNKPFVMAVTPGSAADGARQALREVGCPYVDRIDDAIRMLKHYATWRPMRYAPPVRPSGLPAPGVALPTLREGPLREHEVKAVLAQYGVPIARERFCATVEEAVAAADAIGYPVVLKAVSAALIHKSDIGGVQLGLADAGAVRKAWSAIAVAMDRLGTPARLDGCLVAEMVKAEAELIVGLKHDEQFGPMVLVGFGGTMVELDPDTVLATAPIGTTEAAALLKRLRHWPLLDGYRGRRKTDVAAIADAISRVSWLGADAGRALQELDINPLLVRAADGRPVAVDARATYGGH